jgi:poly-beta-1,6 N-acetyl-D-glucosamine synthase
MVSLVVLAVGLVIASAAPCIFILFTPMQERWDLLGGWGPLFFGFTVLLLLRYCALLWFGHLEHLEDSSSRAQATEPHRPPVTIIVPAFNEGMVIEASIRSLLELEYPHYEVLVVDDGSTDDTLARARALAGTHARGEVRVLTQPNAGKAAALNHGIRAALHDFVLCMDGDSKLSRQSLAHAMRHFADPDIGAVAGNVKVVNRSHLLARLQALEYIEGLNLARRAQSFFRAVHIIPGPMGVFRRRVLLEVGGYPHDTYAEDCDLTLSVLERGWRVAYEPEAIAWTEAPERLLDLVKQRYRWTRGILQAVRKRVRARTAPPALRIAVGWLLFEGLLWPLANIAALVVFAVAAAQHGVSLPLVLWWVQLTVLDVAAALFCVAAEGEDLRLVPLALVHRLAFTTLVDVCKVCATVEEAFRLEMNWGKLERAGRL